MGKRMELSGDWTQEERFALVDLIQKELDELDENEKALREIASHEESSFNDFKRRRYQLERLIDLAKRKPVLFLQNNRDKFSEFLN